MKNIVAAFGILALAAVPAFAQYDQQNLQQDQSQQHQMDQGQGTMVSGTVVSVSEQNVVIRTDAGNTITLQLNDNTDKPSQDLKAGDRIQAWYGSDRAATRIALATGTDASDPNRAMTGEQGTSPGVATGADTRTQSTTSSSASSSLSQDRSAAQSGAASSQFDADRDQVAQRDQFGADRDQMGQDRDRFDADRGNLPQTATNLPLIGLVGLLALAGALAVRFFFRS